MIMMDVAKEGTDAVEGVLLNKLMMTDLALLNYHKLKHRLGLNCSNLN